MVMDNLNCSLWIHNTYADFQKGHLNKVYVLTGTKGGIILEKNNDIYAESGVYTSDIINTIPFHCLILSWNADTPEGTAVKIEAQVLVDKAGQELWSGWLSFGTWSSWPGRSSASKEDNNDELACVDTDTLRVKVSNTETAKAVRYRLTLTTSNPMSTPVIKLIAGTIRNAKTGEDLAELYSNEIIPEIMNLNKELDVPRFSQMLRDPKIASVICSPTSITTVGGREAIVILDWLAPISLVSSS
jgi:hypothetical protein